LSGDSSDQRNILFGKIGRLEYQLVNSFELTALIGIWAVKVIGRKRVWRYLSFQERRAARVASDRLALALWAAKARYML
jgi:hypothetical protein